MSRDKYTGKELRLAWLKSVEALHAETIRDTQPGHKGDILEITEMFCAVGWQWFLKSYGEERKVGDSTIYLYQETYIIDSVINYMEWCGIGLAAAGRRVGDFLEDNQSVNVSLDSEIAYYVMPSTARLASHIQNPRENKWVDAMVDPPEAVEPKDIEPGDIATVGTSWRGSHIIMVKELLPRNKFLSIECNGNGLLGDGTTGEGVITRVRSISEIKQVYRLDERHFYQA